MSRFSPRFLLACLVVALVAVAGSAVAQRATGDVGTPKGPFMIAGGNQSMIWRVDQSTGLISYCMRDTVSNDPALLAQRPPLCSAWGR